MSDTLCILLNLPLTVITAILLLGILQQDKGSVFVRRSILFYATLLGWQICVILYYYVDSASWIHFLFDAGLAFDSIVALAIFWMIAGFYRIHKSFSQRLMPLLAIIPAATAALSLTSPWHTLMTKSWALAAADPLTVVTYVRGFWYYVHIIYCQALVAAIAIIVLRRYRGLPRAYRNGSGFLIISLILYATASLLKLPKTPLPMDAALPAIGLSGFFFYLATIANGRTDYLSIQNREVFNYLDEAIFIVNEKGQIVDTNAAARQLLEQAGLDPEENFRLQQLLDGWEADGLIVRKHLEDEVGDDVYFLGGAYPQIFQMRSQPIADGSLMAGRFVIMANVTNNRLFRERLEEMAGVDALTGLPNRYRYQRLLRELDTGANLPLSIIMGDVNGLKRVNDSYGHYEGDMMLRAVADTLRDCCPAGSYVARIGGDEFVMLLPRCSQQEAGERIGVIRRMLEGFSEKRHRTTIALGCATKTQRWENLNALINQADLLMYDDKREAQE